MTDQLEGRNPIEECLKRARRRVLRLWIDTGTRPDERVLRILELAEAAGVRPERVDRKVLDRKAEGRVHQGMIAEAEPLPEPTTREVLDDVFNAGRHPFLVLADEVSYEHNLGAILRSCLGFGADGLILPTRRGASLSSVVQRVSMGAAEVVPVVREGLSSALKPIRDADVQVVGADAGGTPLGQADLRGPVALVMGGEGKGLSPTLAKRCDTIVAVPLAGGLESLNVSVAAAILMYEKRRQDGWFDVR
ncbi:MAG TPA: 23S rRNA (guanosine(2251)-2'-O)-methyltransferase RlmB [Myxococcota bacterium]|nr:23S rRNA (guanosine(2251)-2'-O)-methyltransferase RlmB [Myxococcota bacterium]